MIHNDQIRKLANDYTPAEIIAAALSLVDDEPDPMGALVAALDHERITLGQVAGATARGLEQLQELSLGLGRTTQFTATQSAEALTTLARAGFSVGESVKTIESTRHRQRQVMLRSIMDGINDIQLRAGHAVDLCREAIVGDGPEMDRLLSALMGLAYHTRTVLGTAAHTEQELAK